jgi:hypothetical protein
MEKKKNKKGKYVLFGLGVLAISGTAYYFIKKRGSSQTNLLEEDFLSDSETTQNFTPITTSSSSKSGFPLKKGSKGELVKRIQLRMINVYGKDILPKYGADGYWGKELDVALKSKGFPTVVTEDMLKKIGVSLSGNLGELDSNTIKTIQKTTIWRQNGTRTPIPSNTILGKFVDAKDGVTIFKAFNNEILYTKTKNISYV